MSNSYSYMPSMSKNKGKSREQPATLRPSTPVLYENFSQQPTVRDTHSPRLFAFDETFDTQRPYNSQPDIRTTGQSSASSTQSLDDPLRQRSNTIVHGMSTDTLSSTGSSTNAIEPSSSSERPNHKKGHKKQNSSHNVIEEVFGIYPERKKMGAGVSLADVVASKLFSRRDKTVAPSPIPTPSQRTSSSASSNPNKPIFHSQRHPQRSVRPQSQKPRGEFFPTRQAEPELVTAPKVLSPVDQHKLDELMARQRLLEQRILELKEERDSLLELDVDHAVRSYDARLDAVPETLSSSPSKQSSAGRAEKSRATSSRQFPSSKTMQPLMTSPMAIPSVIPFNSSAPYTQRPLPQPPSNASPPPEYSPPTVPIPDMQAADVKPFQPDTKEITLTLPGGMHPSVVFREKYSPDGDVKASPRDEVEVDDILGWFDTFKFSSTSPRGRAPLVPLPAIPTNQGQVVEIEIGTSKPIYPDEKRRRSKPRRERRPGVV